MAEITGRKLNAKQLEFAHLVAGGMSQMAAFEQAFGKKGGTYPSELANKPAVAAEIARLKAETAAACDLKRDELVNFLVSIIRTPVGRLDADHPLVQEWTEVETKTSTRRYVKGISKLGAAKLLSGILGWLRPDTDNQGEVRITLKKMWDDEPPVDVTPPRSDWR
jgi:hypothetical protein